MLSRFMPVTPLLLLALPLGCSSATEEEEGAVDQGELRAAAYLVEAPLTANPEELYNKLNVLPSVTSGGGKVTGPGLFGIVCSKEGELSCKLRWVQRRTDASGSFILSGKVAKSIALALPAADRTYENENVRFRCDVQKGGLLSSDLYTCAFSGLVPTLTEVKGSVPLSRTSSLSEKDAQDAIDEYFPKM